MLDDNITGLQHIGLPVTDIQRSKAFYARLGFKVIMSTNIVLPTGIPAQVVMMEHNNFVLELYQLDGEALQEIRTCGYGYIDHFALNATDIDAAFISVRTAGLSPLQDAPVFLPLWEKGVYYFYIEGPDGEKIEFNQRIR